MSLNGALHVGRTALTASQAALQVAGNNMANAATEGFHRRAIHLSPLSDEVIGHQQFVGRGVQIASIQRQVDTALQTRYRDALAQEHSSRIDERFLVALETLQNELTDNDMSSLLSQFFNSFSELANNPSDNAVRAVVIQQGETLAGRIGDMRRDYNVVRQEVDRTIGATVEEVNNILDQISLINGQIAQSEAGVGEAAALRDQRDLLVDQLAEYMDLTVIEHDNGMADILVSSVPVLLAGENRGFEMRRESVDGESRISLRVAADGTQLQVSAGTLGGLMRQREDTVEPAVAALDTFASELIRNVNVLHASGQGQRGFESIAGSYQVSDTSVNLNAGDAGLPFRVENGSFMIHVTHEATGQRTSYQIRVDGDAMSLDDLMNEINALGAVPNVTAGTDAERHFTLEAAAGYAFSFADDTSGALTALGVNTFFSGHNADSISVNQVLRDDPTALAVAANHVSGSNDTALAIAALQDVAIDGLGGVSIRDYWQNAVNDLAVRASAATNAVQSSGLVRESLEAQLQAVSGVSLDEESINLLNFQRQFQAAARYISVIDQSLQALLALV